MCVFVCVCVWCVYVWCVCVCGVCVWVCAETKRDHLATVLVPNTGTNLGVAYTGMLNTVKCSMGYRVEVCVSHCVHVHVCLCCMGLNLHGTEHQWFHGFGAILKYCMDCFIHRSNI